MKISDILHRKGTTVATVQPTLTVTGALDELAAHGIGALIVTDDEGSIAGILSERDIVRRMQERGAEVLGVQIEEIMTTKVSTCTSSTDVVDAMRVMTDGHFRHLPVVDDAQLVGIVSIGDVVKNRIDELQSTTEQLSSYISGN